MVVTIATTPQAPNSPAAAQRSQDQLFASSRSDTAMIVGAALVVPMLLVHIAGFIKAGR